jgi:antitoxin (DNA-binding transcriptional repressor) of toxin-antitoxin stability system
LTDAGLCATIRFVAINSDKPGRERRLSATEASRSFSEVLDEIEAGRRFVVHRHGRDVAVMGPPPVRGRRVAECLEILRGRTPVRLDGRFEEDLLGILAAEPVGEAPAWGS